MKKLSKGRNLKANQRGDTLISIILSFAVITLVIVIAYFLVSRSLSLSQQAREREQVKNLAQSQLAGLNYLAFQDDDGDLFEFFNDEKVKNAGAAGFCLGTPTPPPLPASPSAPFGIGVMLVNDNGEEIPWDPPGGSPNPRNPANDLGKEMTECESFESLKAANVTITIKYCKDGWDSANDACTTDDMDDDNNENLFRVRIEWDRVGGAGKENLVVAERIPRLR